MEEWRIRLDRRQFHIRDRTAAADNAEVLLPEAGDRGPRSVLHPQVDDQDGGIALGRDPHDARLGSSGERDWTGPLLLEPSLLGELRLRNLQAGRGRRGV